MRAAASPAAAAVIPNATSHLPVGEVADRRNEKQNRVCRGNVANRTWGASCSPPGARVPRQCREQDLERVMLAARRAGYRRGISRLCFNRSSVAGIADGQCPLPPATAGGYRAVVSTATQLRATRRCRKQDRERVVSPRKGPPILLGKQRAPIRGISKGAPLGSLLHPFLERKGWRTVSAARWRCSAIGNKNACDATVLQIKPEARSADRRSAA